MTCGEGMIYVNGIRVKMDDLPSPYFDPLFTVMVDGASYVWDEFMGWYFPLEYTLGKRYE